MYRHILIPTDGSPLSNAATNASLDLAKALGARVSVMVVVTPDCHLGAEAGQSRAERESHAAEAARGVLAAARQRARALGVACEAFWIAEDHPHETIIGEAFARGCDLIAMASQGRRGLEALMLGSQTQKVLTGSRMPVLVYR